MAEKITCPRCGVAQPASENCSSCGVHIQRYIELKKSRYIVPSRYSQQRRDEERREIDRRALREKLAEKPPPSRDKEEAPHGESEVPPPLPEEEVTQVELQGLQENLTGIGDLFQSSWEIFKRRFWSLIALYLLSIVFFTGVFGVFFGSGFFLSRLFAGAQNVILGGSGFVGAIAGLIAMCWGIAAFVCAVADESLSIRDALSEGSQKIWSFLWVFSLFGYIIAGGFFLAFIPGVIFWIWFLFSQFILAKEDVRGMDSLLKSKEYVKGYWFDVFLRLFLVWVISVVIGMIPFIGWLGSLVFFPFLMIFTFLIYDDLKKMKGSVPSEYTSGEKAKWIGIATLGHFIIPIIIIIVLGASITSGFFFLQNILKM
jgi:hypothetical protein